MSESLRICNALLLGNERYQMVRAAKFAEAGRHSDAERLREQLGYSGRFCRNDVDKVS